MPRKRHTPEEIIHKLRDAELALAKGAPNGDAGHQFGVTEQTYYRWRKEYGGMQVDQAKRLKDLERENARLKRLLAAGGKRRSVGRIAGECPLAIQFGGAAHPSPSAALVQRAPDPWRRCILGIPEQRRRRSNRRRRRGSGPRTAFSGETAPSSAHLGYDRCMKSPHRHALILAVVACLGFASFSYARSHFAQDVGTCAEDRDGCECFAPDVCGDREVVCPAGPDCFMPEDCIDRTVVCPPSAPQGTAQ